MFIDEDLSTKEPTLQLTDSIDHVNEKCSNNCISKVIKSWNIFGDVERATINNEALGSLIIRFKLDQCRRNIIQNLKTIFIVVPI